MIHRLKVLAMIPLVVLLLGFAVFAAPTTTESGIYGIQNLDEAAVASVSALALNDEKLEVLPEADSYPTAVALRITLNAKQDSLNLVIAQSEDDAPKAANIEFIDQETANGNEVVFDVYPKNLEDGEYIVKYSSSESTELKTVVKFSYKNPVKLGDVDDDGSITVADATATLRIFAKLDEPNAQQKQAADVDKDNSVTVADATKILRVFAKLDSFE